jgi:hypothetical protein
MSIGKDLKAESKRALTEQRSHRRRQEASRRQSESRDANRRVRDEAPSIFNKLVEELRVKAASGGGVVEWRWATYSGWTERAGEAVAKELMKRLEAEDIEVIYEPYSSSGTVDGDGYSRDDDFRAGVIKAKVEGD